jgi:Zn-dependent protease
VEFSPLATVGWSAVAVVIACWLTLSFAAPGPTRLRAGWLGAAAMYVAFGCLFLSLFLRARGNESLAGTIGFGFLLAFFSVGFVLAALRMLRAFAGKAAGKIESATN